MCCAASLNCVYPNLSPPKNTRDEWRQFIVEHLHTCHLLLEKLIDAEVDYPTNPREAGSSLALTPEQIDSFSFRLNKVYFVYTNKAQVKRRI